MKIKLALLTFATGLVAQSATAGITPIPPTVVGVPVDSPWVIFGLVATLAVVGARILQSRRK